MLNLSLIERNPRLDQDLHYKAPVGLVNYTHEYDQQTNNRSDKQNLFREFDEKQRFFEEFLILPAILTTDARVILDADAPSES